MDRRVEEAFVSNKTLDVMLSLPASSSVGALTLWLVISKLDLPSNRCVVVSLNLSAVLIGPVKFGVMEETCRTTQVRPDLP